MFFTNRRKKILTFLLLGALLFEQCNGMTGYSLLGRTAQAQKKSYQNVEEIGLIAGAEAVDDTLQVQVMAMEKNTTSSVTLSWECGLLTGESYYIYRYNEETKSYEYAAHTEKNTWTCTGLKPAQKYYFTVCVYDKERGVQSAFAAPVVSYTKPQKVTEVTFTDNQKDSISVTWKAVDSAKGYFIYRADSSGEYEKIAAASETSYTDKKLTAGKTYKYKVCAYFFNQSNCGSMSAAAKMTTLPEAPVTITVKGGNKKARINWSAVPGASGYYVYWYNGTKYQYLAALEGKKSTQYIHTNLTNGKYSKYKVKAYRTLYEVNYTSAASTGKKSLVSKQTTVTSPKLYKTKTNFKNSSAYKECTEFQKTVKYDKSYVIPGLSGTDVDGFYSKDMCPQGLTFAGSYLLLSAYDKKGEENSVVYVMNTSDRKLVLTVVLPNKTHAGGIAYDGTNLWVTQTNTVRSISFAGIQKAIAENQTEYLAGYQTICTLTHAASALTYYKSRLWVASYDELAAGYLGVYTIKDKTGSPALEQYALTRISTRVQGLTFTSGGKLILSRSCQTDSNKRGFLHVLDVYKPDLSKLSKGTITMGAVKKTIEMPSMNEEIAISGKYLYVNFESAAFSQAVKPMDRVCAFKTSSIVS